MECFTYLRNMLRYLVWWENTIRETLWRTIQRTNHPVWFIGWELPYLCERPVKNPSILERKVLPGFFWICEELETMDASGIYAKLNAKEVIFPKEWKIHLSSRRWTNQTSLRRSGTKNIHLDTGSPNSRRRSKTFSRRGRRVSHITNSRIISRCRWSTEWLLVHVRKLHIPSSRWTQSQTVRADWRIIHCSTEIHWRYQNYKNEFGCCARTPHRWLLEYRWIIVWFLDRFHSVYSIGRETSRRIYVVPRLQKNNLRCLQASQDYEGSLQISSWKFSGRRFSNSMDSILSVQDKNFSGDGKEFTDISRANWKAESHLHKLFLGIWQVLRGIIFPGIIVRQRHTDQKQMGLQKSSAQSETRDICGVVAIRSGWKNGGRIPWSATAVCGRHSGSFVWWEDALWKVVRRAI